MQNDVPKPEENLSADVQDVMKLLISAIRIVKVYPSNNPIYSQSMQKAFEALSRFLESSPEYRLAVQKTHFTYENTAFGKDGQVNRSIAQDLFSKSVREIIFTAGLTEEEFVTLCQSLSLSREELDIKSGISSILWEKGVTHIKTTEAGLDDVITTRAEDGWGAGAEGFGSILAGSQEKKAAYTGKTLVLGDLRTDPAGFGAGMVAFAMKTKGEHETVEDRLFSLYQQAGKKIQKDHIKESEELFDGLAKSILALDQQYRERLIAGKLYGDLDAELAEMKAPEDDLTIPNVLQEVQTGRFGNVWTVPQVATLLKRSAQKGPAPAKAPKPVQELDVEPVSPDLIETARSLVENPDPEDDLRRISEAGMESDIIEAAIRTLIALMPLVKNPVPWSKPEKELALFSGVITQLEDILSYLLQKNAYDLATMILKAFQSPMPPEFQPRLTEALKKTATKSVIVGMISDMRKHPKSSVEYQAACSYLATLERKVVGVLFELLADENDRDARIFLLDLLKDFGKSQVSLLGEQLTDGRWYVVRNIVSILSENKSDQAILLLRRAADHQNLQVRQEVLKALIANKGKKAATVLARFFRDTDESMRLAAIRAFAGFSGMGDEEVRPLVEFLEAQPLSSSSLDMSLEAIRTLGRVGGSEAAGMLERYPRRRWWKSRKLQKELRQAALASVGQIRRRQGNDGQRQ
jgi:hypothetical protein